jgi:hypothetical protein
LSHAGANNGRAGNIWSVYVYRAQQQQFLLLDDTLTMHLDTISNWSPIPRGWSFDSITAYHAGSASGGSLVTYSLEDERVVAVATPVSSLDGASSDYTAAMDKKMTVPLLWSTVVR